MCSGRRASGVAVNRTSASCHHSLGSSISSAPFAHLRVTSQYVTTLSRLGPVSRAVLAAVLRRPGAPSAKRAMFVSSSLPLTDRLQENDPDQSEHPSPG